MNSPTIAIVPHFRANNEVIANALAHPRTPGEVKTIIDRNQHYTGYEIVPEHGDIRIYADWDCELQYDNTTNYEEKKQKVYDEALSNLIEMGFPQDKIYFSHRHGRKGDKYKVSWRATVVGMKTTRKTLNKVMQRFRDKHLNIFKQEHSLEHLGRRELLDRFKETPKGWLDIGVYSKNRKMGLVGCIKKFPEDQRRLEQQGDYPHHYTLITCVGDNDEVYIPEEFDTSSQDANTDRSDDDYDNSSTSINAENYIVELQQAGFSNIRFDSSGYRFRCDQNAEGAECPCCGGNHTGNQYSVLKNEQGEVWVFNLTPNGCSYKKIKDGMEHAGFLFEDVVVDTQATETPETNDYESMKRYFEEERQVTMIEDGLVYILDDKHLLNRKELIETFQDFIIKGKKRDIPFTDKWLRDPNKSKNRRMDFLPQGAPPDVYNLWRGYKVDQLECSAEEGDVTPFKQLLQVLTNSLEGEECYNYMLKWTALMFQKPHEKTRVCVVIRSEEGIGKNSYGWLLGEKLMGNDLYKETNQPEHDLFAEHTNAMERRKLVVLDEADVFRFHAKICPLITNPETRVRKMYMNPTHISNFAQLMILSNNSVPVKISPSDRRYVVFDGNTNLKGNKEFWNRFYGEWSNDPKNQKAVHDYLMGVDLEGFDFWAERPMTEAYQEIRTASLPVEIKFLTHHIVDAYPLHINSPNLPMRGTELYSLYERYNPSGLEMTPARFGARLKNFLRTKGVYSENTPPEERNIFHKNRTQEGVSWYIKRQEAFEWLQREQFIPATITELPRPINYQSNNGFEPSRISRTF